MHHHSRREFLYGLGSSLGAIALTDLIASEGFAAASGAVDSPLAPKPPMHPAKAKAVIMLFMEGGPSQVDTFDYKPELDRRSGQTASFDQTRSGESEERTLFGSPWSFRQHGQCGRHVSSLFPNIAQHVDRMCFVHSMRTTGTAHGQATLFMHTGSTNLVRPSMGSWVCWAWIGV